jgi:hypothetical protein
MWIDNNASRREPPMPIEAQEPTDSPEAPRRTFLLKILTALGAASSFSQGAVLGRTGSAWASDCDPNTQSCGSPTYGQRSLSDVRMDGARIRDMVTDMRGRVAAGQAGVGMPLVATYESKGGRNPQTIQVLRGIESHLSRTNLAGLPNEQVDRLVGQAITNYARQGPASMASGCGKDYPVEGSACRTLFQFGGSDLHQTMTQAGHRIPGYNAPAAAPGQRVPRQP